MIEVQGALNSAKVFTEALEKGAEAQIRALCDQAFARGSRIRVMPDVHAGMGCTIGTTMTLTDVAVPNLVGVDIGCGMETARLTGGRIELPKLDSMIKKRIPSGFSVRDAPHALADGIDLRRLHCAGRVDLRRALLSVGTLGGGNHFIEVDRGEKDGALYLVIHSGSRHLGTEVARFYQDEGFRRLGGKKQPVPHALAYVEGELFRQYIDDMRLTQRFADINRKAMLREIVSSMRLEIAEQFTTVHNYIDTDAMILRKGAVSARAGERLLIPVNMRDGSLICTGLGNADWNESAPHGAGRLYSRKAAKEAFTVSQFEKEMREVYTTTVGRGTLDECPMAYKPMDEILRQIGPTAAVEQVIRPIYNFKAGGD